MKTLVLLAFLLPLTVAAQTETDYQHVMAKFQRFYNAGQGDSIHAMFQPSIQLAVGDDTLWTKKQTVAMLKQYGTLKSFTFLGIDKTDPNNVYVFQTFFSKGGAQTTCLTLDENSRLGTFRFITSSEGINALLKKRKASR